MKPTLLLLALSVGMMGQDRKLVLPAQGGHEDKPLVLRSTLWFRLKDGGEVFQKTYCPEINEQFYVSPKGRKMPITEKTLKRMEDLYWMNGEQTGEVDYVFATTENAACGADGGR
jgi:hypothetical protein